MHATTEKEKDYIHILHKKLSMCVPMVSLQPTV